MEAVADINLGKLLARLKHQRILLDVEKLICTQRV